MYKRAAYLEMEICGKVGNLSFDSLQHIANFARMDLTQSTPDKLLAFCIQ